MKWHSVLPNFFIFSADVIPQRLVVIPSHPRCYTHQSTAWYTESTVLACTCGHVCVCSCQFTNHSSNFIVNGNGLKSFIHSLCTWRVHLQFHRLCKTCSFMLMLLFRHAHSCSLVLSTSAKNVKCKIQIDLPHSKSCSAPH